VNHLIHAKQVRLIGADGEQVGIVKFEDAKRLAEEASLDLVEISPNEQPPVCRIMDYGKHVFQLNKKKAAAKKKQRHAQIKELKYRPGIGEGDYKVKLRKLLEIIEEGDKVKITVRFRGREVMHHDLGFKLLDRLQIDVTEFAIVEQTAKFEGKQVVMILGSKKKK
jgi:translation initiation factor IF-3